MTLIRKLVTGNIPVAQASTVVPFEKKAEFNVKAADGMRFSFVTYKVTKTIAEAAKTKDIVLGKSFALPVPILKFDTLNSKHVGFLADLAADHQDSIIDATAKASKATKLVDYLDVDKMIADYYDSSKSGYKVAEIAEWYEEVFTVAYVARVMQRNAEDGKETTSAAQVELVVKAYADYTKGVCKATCGLPVVQVKALRQTLDKLIELKFLKTDDEITMYVLSQARKFEYPEIVVVESNV